MEIGSAEMGFEEAERLVGQAVANSDEGIVLESLAETSKSEIIIKDGVIFYSHDEGEFEVLQGVQIVESFCD